uniref:Membrane protein ORF109 n=1 Tax=Anguillid herpesvirus 1 TaxID=150286 RepID=A0A8E5ALG1_9VIRU|nr:membrane protein ORF109 [Anguillid herpesvirus 1]
MQIIILFACLATCATLSFNFGDAEEDEEEDQTNITAANISCANFSTLVTWSLPAAPYTVVLEKPNWLGFSTVETFTNVTDRSLDISAVVNKHWTGSYRVTVNSSVGALARTVEFTYNPAWISEGDLLCELPANSPPTVGEVTEDGVFPVTYKNNLAQFDDMIDHGMFQAVVVKLAIDGDVVDRQMTTCEQATCEYDLQTRGKVIKSGNYEACVLVSSTTQPDDLVTCSNVTIEVPVEIACANFSTNVSWASGEGPYAVQTFAENSCARFGVHVTTDRSVSISSDPLAFWQSSFYVQVTDSLGHVVQSGLFTYRQTDIQPGEQRCAIPRSKPAIIRPTSTGLSIRGSYENSLGSFDVLWNQNVTVKIYKDRVSWFKQIGEGVTECHTRVCRFNVKLSTPLTVGTRQIFASVSSTAQPNGLLSSANVTVSKVPTLTIACSNFVTAAEWTLTGDRYTVNIFRGAELVMTSHTTNQSMDLSEIVAEAPFEDYTVTVTGEHDNHRHHRDTVESGTFSYSVQSAVHQVCHVDPLGPVFHNSTSGGWAVDASFNNSLFGKLSDPSVTVTDLLINGTDGEVLGEFNGRCAFETCNYSIETVSWDGLVPGEHFLCFNTSTQFMRSRQTCLNVTVVETCVSLILGGIGGRRALEWIPELQQTLQEFTKFDATSQAARFLLTNTTDKLRTYMSTEMEYMSHEDRNLLMQMLEAAGLCGSAQKLVYVRPVEFQRTSQEDSSASVGIGTGTGLHTVVLGVACLSGIIMIVIVALTNRRRKVPNIVREPARLAEIAV